MCRSVLHVKHRSASRFSIFSCSADTFSVRRQHPSKFAKQHFRSPHALDCGKTQRHENIPERTGAQVAAADIRWAWRLLQ